MMNAEGKTLPPEDCCYCMLRIYDGWVLYNGDSLRLAACALEPGTVYGKAPSELAAKVAARQALANWRAVKKRSGLSDPLKRKANYA